MKMEQKTGENNVDETRKLIVYRWDIFFKNFLLLSRIQGRQTKNLVTFGFIFLFV